MDDGGTPEKDSIGLLGDDILSQYDVEFDFPGRTLTFYREDGCYTTFLPWIGGYSTIPFDHRGAKVTIDVLLNSERTRAIIDTGNNLSFVSLSASALWGAATDDLAPTSARIRSPLNGGAPMPVSAYPFAQVEIGDELFQDKKFGVVDVGMPLASANLGLDYWSSRGGCGSLTHTRCCSSPTIRRRPSSPIRSSPSPSRRAARSRRKSPARTEAGKQSETGGASSRRRPSGASSPRGRRAVRPGSCTA